MARSTTVDMGQAIKESFDPDSASLSVNIMSSLVPQKYDEIDLSYTGDNLTGVVYKSAGVTVATLTLTYAGSTLTNVVRT